MSTENSKQSDTGNKSARGLSSRPGVNRGFKPEKQHFRLGKENTPNLKVIKEGLGDLVQLIIYSSDTRVDNLSIIFHRPIGSLELDNDDWVASSFDDYHFLQGDQSNESHMKEILKLRENFILKVSCLLTQETKSPEEVNWLAGMNLVQPDQLAGFFVKDPRKPQSNLSIKWPEAIQGKSFGWLKETLKSESKTPEDTVNHKIWKEILKQFHLFVESTGLGERSKTFYPAPELREVTYRNSAPQQAVTALRGISNQLMPQALIRYLSGDLNYLERYRKPGLTNPIPKIPKGLPKVDPEEKGEIPVISTSKMLGGTKNKRTPSEALTLIEEIMSNVDYNFRDFSRALLALSSRYSGLSEQLKIAAMPDIKKSLTQAKEGFSDVLSGNPNAFINH